MARESTDSCSWCGNPIGRGEGWRAQEIPGSRRAAFCRLEHVVPWHIQGPHWEPGALDAVEPLGECARCGEPLGDVRLMLVSHRGDHRIADGFCSGDHMAAWAKAGGRWQS